DAGMPQPLDVKRAVRQRLEILRLAGVEWVACARGLAVEDETEEIAEAQAAVSFEAPAVADVAELEALKGTVSAGTRCRALVACRKQTVFGVGRLHPELCFIGEAPGADEDAQGEPFVGAAGQLLNRIISACQMKREDVYICNIIKCRPPGNRTPVPDEI